MGLFHKVFILAGIMLITTCCTKDNDLNDRLCFIGDSLVTGWDVKYYFPDRITSNDAVGSSGVALLEAHHDAYRGQIAVVLSGTNDLGLIKLEDEQAYIERYLAAVIGLGAKQTYLLSILPRDDEWSRAEPLISNSRIKSFNEKIKNICDSKPDVTYVDAFDLLLRDGTPNAAYYYDGLHLTTAGYEVISTKLQRYL